MRKQIQTLSVIALALLLSITPKQNSMAQAEVADTQDVSQVFFRASDEKLRFEKYDKNIFQDDSYTMYLENIEDNMKVTFSSTNTSILTVKKLSNSSCRVTGEGYGTARVKAKITIDNGFFLFNETETLTAKLNVSPHAASVKFRSSQKKVTLHDSVKLAMTIRPSISREIPSFQTKNKRIATISKKGVVTGKKTGSTYVTATLDNGKSASCKILVQEPDDAE